MADALKITVDELRRRMDAGEDFTIVDVRNPQGWAEADTKIPEAIRISTDNLERNLSQLPEGTPVVAYCT